MSVTRVNEVHGETPEKLPPEEAAEAAHMSTSSVGHWAPPGAIDSRSDSRRGGARILVDADEVFRHAGSGREPMGMDRPSPTLLLAACAVLNHHRANEAETRAAHLEERVRELESWISGEARFEEVEHVQLGRLLALASAERDQRRAPLLLSRRAVLLFVYSAAAMALAILLSIGQV